jgi:hypothetical protein
MDGAQHPVPSQSIGGLSHPCVRTATPSAPKEHACGPHASKTLEPAGKSASTGGAGMAVAVGSIFSARQACSAADWSLGASCRRHAKAAPASYPPAHAPFLPDARVPRVSDSKSEGAGRPTPGSGVVGQSMLARTPRAVSGFRFAAPASDPTGLDGQSPLRGLPNTTPGSHQSRRRSSWRPSLSRGWAHRLARGTRGDRRGMGSRAYGECQAWKVIAECGRAGERRAPWTQKAKIDARMRGNGRRLCLLRSAYCGL